jgi:signal transduction histidine kinase
LSRFTLFSTILFFSLLGFVFFWFFKRYKERERIQKELLIKTVESEKQLEFLNAQEEERSRIALELHDGLGSLLSSVKLRLETKKIVQKENSFDDILRDLSIACSEVRMISHNLNNFSLSMGDFKNSMKDYVMSFKTERLKVNFQFTQNNTYELPEKTKHHILRIVQELVGNVVKHANASEMNVGIVINDETLTALIEDNGVGFDLNGEHNGIGLKNVQIAKSYGPLRK